MNEEFETLSTSLIKVGGDRPKDGRADLFDSGLDSLQFLSLLAEVKAAGYSISMDDLIDPVTVDGIVERMRAGRQRKDAT